jgi:hypothetical protein
VCVTVGSNTITSASDPTATSPLRGKTLNTCRAGVLGSEMILFVEGEPTRPCWVCHGLTRRAEDKWSRQLDRQLVRCPRSGWRLELWVCTPAQPRPPRGRWQICDGVPFPSPAPCTTCHLPCPPFLPARPTGHPSCPLAPRPCTPTPPAPYSCRPSSTHRPCPGMPPAAATQLPIFQTLFRLTPSEFPEQRCELNRAQRALKVAAVTNKWAIPLPLSRSLSLSLSQSISPAPRRWTWPLRTATGSSCPSSPSCATPCAAAPRCRSRRWESSGSHPPAACPPPSACC